MQIRTAHAKLNLSLCVGPPESAGSLRAGYHRIVSWMHAIDLADEIRVNRTVGASRFCVRWADDAPRPSPIDWPLEKDLAVRAHAALEAAVGVPLPVDLEVVKRIPVGGGLGGGSSDAAATLLALIDEFEIAIEDGRLLDIAMRLGSDVGFFCDRQKGPPRPAVVTGFGESIRRVAPIDHEAVLIMPPFGCETRAVYRAFDRRLGAGSMAADLAADQALHADGPLTALDLDRRNDLQPAAEEVSPQLALVREAVGRMPGLESVAMSGSGSTLFALVTNGDAGQIAKACTPKLPPAALVLPTGLVG